MIKHFLFHFLKISRKLLELATCHNIVLNSLYILSGNDVIICFQLAANGINVFNLGRVWKALQPWKGWFKCFYITHLTCLLLDPENGAQVDPTSSTHYINGQRSIFLKTTEISNPHISTSVTMTSSATSGQLQIAFMPLLSSPTLHSQNDLFGKSWKLLELAFQHFPQRITLKSLDFDWKWRQHLHPISSKGSQLLNR